MSEEYVKLVVEGTTAKLILQRPKQLNALNQEVIRQLDAHLTQLEKQKDVRSVILCGEGRAFAAGADIAEMVDIDSLQAAEFSRLGQKVFAKLEALPQPTIALIQGYALGGGLEVALACDIRIAAEGAKLGQPEVSIGVLPGFGGSQRLPRIIGQGRALHMLLTGEPIDAQTALAYGLVTAVVKEEELMEEGIKLANKFAKLPVKALHFIKRAVYEGAETDLERGTAQEAAFFALAFSTNDRKEGMQAFLERRKPEFRGE